jgi:carboxylate-amine ligase
MLAASADRLVEDPLSDGLLSYEFKQEQIEIGTSPCRSMAQLYGDAAARRRHLAAVASRHGVLACASGTSPLAGTPTVVQGQRFARITEEFAAVATGQLTCGMHVHVAVSSAEEGVGVLDRIRPWLAPLTALAANSPFWQGADSGYASYRTVVLSQLPPLGPAPIWGDVEAYRRSLEQVIRTGAAFDPAMVYYDARLSARYPTVEIRVTDVCVELDEVVLIAALCRALVDTAAREWTAGESPLDLAVPVLRSASWRAGRHGMSEQLFDPERTTLAPAWLMVGRLVAHVRPALERNGDLEVVRRGLAAIARRGTGAQRQRAARRAGLTLAEILVSTALRERAPDSLQPLAARSFS